MAFLDSAILRAIFTAILLLLVFTVYMLVNRLYLSPIAKFPGPKLAAATFWYEFYYDVMLRGRYTFKIGELHDKYGPIIRINPYELHIRDHEFLATLYPLQTKSVEKWPWAMRMFGHLDTMFFATSSHALHHVRRKAIGPFFSKQFVAKSESVIQRNVDELCLRLEACSRAGRPTNLIHQFSGMAGDVASEFALGKVINSPDEVNYGERSYKMFMSISEYGHIMKQIPWLINVLEALPEWFAKLTNEPAYDSIQFQKFLYKECAKIFSKKPDEKSLDSSATILGSLYNNPHTPASERNAERILAEAQAIILAGTGTVADALNVGIYHLVTNPPILDKLRQELSSATAASETTTPLSLRQLESLPYLKAVMHETLRLTHGVCHRLQRVHPHTTLEYKSWDIPPGTPVGMSNAFMCDNPLIFPSPRDFQPQRWMGPDAPDFWTVLNTFGRGTRQCIGVNIAFAEMRLALAAVVMRFGDRLKVHEGVVRERDIDMYHDFFSPSARSGEKQGCVVWVEKAV